ncbi:NADH dehydrogenase [ubiquinone] 1 alpha subcomplex assembly factor 2 isoform X1 [Hemicordylus capensis]|uniref:NADH dehydrogenase [ubiquinone] 1 alpha subcomplex assembly factor 2 isoform X1 n=1 Tax=Hemicordylus capensis TaxID=884348 RepID=UPI0023032673|nr:NADH dehydrogenase [ubiquinone] 1 alpha subcomplex assembly factor 2 isoform X1 [Hemicordylus capensis]
MSGGVWRLIRSLKLRALGPEKQRVGTDYLGNTYYRIPKHKTWAGYPSVQAWYAFFCIPRGQFCSGSERTLRNNHIYCPASRPGRPQGACTMPEHTRLHADRAGSTAAEEAFNTKAHRSAPATACSARSSTERPGDPATYCLSISRFSSFPTGLKLSPQYKGPGEYRRRLYETSTTVIGVVAATSSCPETSDASVSSARIHDTMPGVYTMDKMAHTPMHRQCCHKIVYQPSRWHQFQSPHERDRPSIAENRIVSIMEEHL